MALSCQSQGFPFSPTNSTIHVLSFGIRKVHRRGPQRPDLKLSRALGAELGI